ncbi:MAG: ATP-binding cassette domain-containing protein [Bdellovibrionales bacterium]
MASVVIELRSVSMSFGKDKILKNINFSLNRGEIFVLVGPTGLGKSVLLKIMAGILPPTEGEVWIEGQDFYKLPTQKQDEIRKKMGMLFQKNALFDSLTSGDNIGFPILETTQLNTNDIQDKITFYLNEVGLLSARNLFPSEISGGMQKRLGIARALALDPEIIFYDDPTAGLDPITSKKIAELILSINKFRKSTAFVITNDMNRAFQLATRMGMLVDHELIVMGSPEDTKKFNDPRVRQFIRGELIGPLTSVTADVVDSVSGENV